MHTYLYLLRKVLIEGVRKDDRTGTGTFSLFGEQFRHDLSHGFPLLTTKRIPFKSVALELIWFLRGDTNAKWLEDQGVTIWKEWGDQETREMGPIYGKSWRSWGRLNVDQIANVILGIKANPDSRRLVVTAWNPDEVDDAALPPCHILFQFYVSDGKLSCQMYQRSADIFLGVPFNIASYALLTMMIAHVTGLQPSVLTICFGDLHLYTNHVEQAMIQIRREPKIRAILKLNPTVKSIDAFLYEDFRLEEYDPWPSIPAPVAV